MSAAADEAAVLQSMGVQVFDEHEHRARVIAAAQVRAAGGEEAIFDLLPFVPEGFSLESVMSTARTLRSAVERAPPGADRAELRMELQMALALASEMGAATTEDAAATDRAAPAWSTRCRAAPAPACCDPP